MKKKTKIIITVIIAILFIIALIMGGLWYYNKWRIAHAKVIVVLKDNLKTEVYSKKKLSDFIVSLNGKLKSKDYELKTTKLGKQKLNFKYINEENIEIPYSFEVEIVDTTPPIIFSGKTKTITKGYSEDLAKNMFCGDDYDNNPRCEIIGYYDINKAGEYKLTYSGTDSSGNVSTNDFTLYVKNPQPSSSGTPAPTNFILYEDIVAKHKKDNTKIGIDVSKWQGNINFQRVKDAGVEFAFVRLGSMRGDIGGDDYFVDEKFERNIKGFNEVGIPVGVYFYSYANSIEAAKREAKWIAEQLKPYKDMIDLEVAFDWENWSFYPEFGVSFYTLTEMANAYFKTLEKYGYKGLLYSSKNYLLNVWHKTKYPVWLAHYTDKTDYDGMYKYWQLTSEADVPGIYGSVDVNIMYTN